MLLSTLGCEIYIEPQLDAGIFVNGQDVVYLSDFSGKGRTMAGTSTYPSFSSSAINGKAAAVWDGTKNPLKNAAVFTVQCGFLVVKINEATFSNYAGILTDITAFPILVGNNGTTKFFDNLQSAYFYEFRSSDRIYPAADAPAPMNAWRIIFFRFWKPVEVNGIQIGQDRGITGRKAKMSLGLMSLYSRNFLESEIRESSQILADNFALTLADVYPYQADVDNTPERPVQSVNFYDPPEGDRISEVIDSARKTIDLKFSGADQTEVKAMKKYHAEHYAPALPCLYRDYRFTPPEDIEGYIDSPYDLDGANNDFNYGFRFKGK